MIAVINPEEYSATCEKILDLSHLILNLLEKDQVEEALDANVERLAMIKDFSESLGGYRSPEITKFCGEYIRLHEVVVAKILDMQRNLQDSLQNRHASAKKVCAYQNVSRIGG